MVDDTGRGRGAAWRLIVDTRIRTIGDDGVDDGEGGRPRRRRDQDAVAGRSVGVVYNEILKHAVFDDKVAARIEHDAVIGSAGAVDLQTGQGDVARTRTDGDAVAGRRSGDRGPAVAVDGDRAGDGDRTIFAGIERRDNAVGPDFGIGLRERGTRRGDGAGIAAEPRR